MREILFKGKCVDCGEWVEGCYIRDVSRDNSGELRKFAHRIQPLLPQAFAHPVDPDTICQYTGLTDKNGQKIWENDIVRRTDLHLTEQPSVGIIEYDVENTAFVIHWIDVVNYSPTYPWKDKIEVIGNVFDNPELLTGGVE